MQMVVSAVKDDLLNFEDTLNVVYRPRPWLTKRASCGHMHRNSLGLRASVNEQRVSEENKYNSKTMSW